jgi:hypothetical protein
MSRRATGIAFCGIAAFLFGIRYIAAAIYISNANLSEYGFEVYMRWMGYIGSLPWIFAGVALIIGIGYLVWAEFEKRPLI